MRTSILILLLIIIISGAVAFSGGIPSIPNINLLTNTTNAVITASAGQCCDTGNGDACQPQPNTSSFVYTKNGHTYGLLKSDIVLAEGTSHLSDSGQKTSDGYPIIYNDATVGGFGNECSGQQVGYNQIWGNGKCYAIPKDELLYACKTNCSSSSGNRTYDVYFDMSDYPTPGVPDPIKNCTITGNSQVTTHTVIVTPVPVAGKDAMKLQLRTFTQETIVANAGSSTWISPYCKPAIYLYPTQGEFVNVRVNPIGGFYVTIPTYPAGGWNVFAQPDGNLFYQGINYDYLYYESKIPDAQIIAPTQGYVVEPSKLSKLFANILPKLGLNPVEQQQFTEYWLKALPDSPYYFVGVMPVAELDKFSSLQITPNPDTLLRITLYFKPLSKFVSVEQPNIQSVTRQGFTAVEWGGIYKKDPRHNFTCLM